jgi:hypothetical protein
VCDGFAEIVSRVFQEVLPADEASPLSVHQLAPGGVCVELVVIHDRRISERCLTGGDSSPRPQFG